MQGVLGGGNIAGKVPPVRQAIWLADRTSHSVRQQVLEGVFSHDDRLSAEQRTAIEHVAKTGAITAVVGRASAGKTTMMKAAREAWELAGYCVVAQRLPSRRQGPREGSGHRKPHAGVMGAALERGQGRARRKDHLRPRQGRHGRLQADGAGAVRRSRRKSGRQAGAGRRSRAAPADRSRRRVRAIVERIGYAELETIYRQREEWMRTASLNLARGRITEAISAYREQGRVLGPDLKAEAVTHLIADGTATTTSARVR